MAKTTKSTADDGEAKSTKRTTKAGAAAKAPAKSTQAKGAKAGDEQGADSDSPFDQKFLDEQRKLLHTERERYFRSAVSLKAEADALVESREPGDVQFDEESGEGDTLAVERERDLALSAHARQAVEEIDAALERLDAGTYGVCEVSGKPIPKERLKAIPWATTRVEYKAGGLRLR